MYTRGAGADTEGMNEINGIGIGLTVGLACAITLHIVDPGAPFSAYLVHGGFYGMVFGFLFHIWKLSLKDWRPPFMRG
jgi:hypothetical protein